MGSDLCYSNILSSLGVPMETFCILLDEKSTAENRKTPISAKCVIHWLSSESSGCSAQQRWDWVWSECTDLIGCSHSGATADRSQGSGITQHISFSHIVSDYDN